jgi:DNA integrity scanning protein DisA with diadenylate cyclase activity
VGETECGQILIGPSVEDVAIGKRMGALRRKRRLIEMGCVDGAVVFDDEHLLAVGAIIEPHSSVGNQLGARTTAARSAYLWGAHPIKVSSDGDVTIYFKSRNGAESCDAMMHFL